MSILKWIINKKKIESERELEDSQYNHVLMELSKTKRELEDTKIELFNHLTKAEKKKLEKARK